MYKYFLHYEFFDQLKQKLVAFLRKGKSPNFIINYDAVYHSSRRKTKMYSITKKAIILGIIIAILPSASFAKNINVESEKICLAKAIYHESKSEPELGKKGVAKVVLNRKQHEKFPKTICGVINQVSKVDGKKQYQFSWVPAQHKVKLNKELWDDSLDLSEDILNKRVSLPNFNSNVLYFKSVKSRVRFGRGYKLVQRIGKQNFYEKTI